MPYHIHILNGLLPSLKLLEKKFEKEEWLNNKDAPIFLRCFITGYTFHDINKLTGSNELNDDIEEYLVPLCKELKLDDFFPQWREWIDEIKFLVLGTEYRTKIYAHQKIIKDYDFFNTVFGDFPKLLEFTQNIGICCFTSKLPSVNNWKKFPNCKNGILVKYDKIKIEDYLAKTIGLGNCFKNIEYLENPTVFEQVDEYHILLNDNGNFKQHISFKRIENNPKLMDQLFLKMFTRLSKRFEKQKDRKSTRLNSSHTDISRMPSSA